MNYSSLKSDIAAVVKQNGNQEITGENLQGVLTEMIDNSVGTGYLYKGIATPETQGGTPDQNVFYLAGAGTYGNFGGTIIPKGFIGIFSYNGVWSYNILEISESDIFDISEYNNTSYANLSAALNGNNIPVNVRKGGMSVKFVQTSDNKYVQFRLMSDSFNTTVANWQGVDDEPIAESDNLVKSGGVYCDLYGIQYTKEYQTQQGVNFDTENDRIFVNNYNEGDKIYIKLLYPTTMNLSGFDFYKGNTRQYRVGEVDGVQVHTNEEYCFTLETDIDSIRISTPAVYVTGGKLVFNIYKKGSISERINTLDGKINEIDGKINDVDDEPVAGSGNLVKSGGVYCDLYGIQYTKEYQTQQGVNFDTENDRIFVNNYNEGDKIYIKLLYPTTMNLFGFDFYKGNTRQYRVGEVDGVQVHTNEEYCFTLETDIDSIRISTPAVYVTGGKLVFNIYKKGSISERIETLEGEINEIDAEVETLVGNTERLRISDMLYHWLKGEAFPLGFLGDSTTDGVQVTGWTGHAQADEAEGGAGAIGVVDYQFEGAYPTQLQNLLRAEIGNNVKIYNIGYSGESLISLKPKLETLFSGVYSDTKMVAIVLGINDRKLNFTDAQYYESLIENLEYYCNFFIERNITPLMVTNQTTLQGGNDGGTYYPITQDYVQTLCNEAKKKIASKYNLEIIDMNTFDRLLLMCSSYQNIINDKLHFSYIGHKLESQFLFSKLIPWVCFSNYAQTIYFGFNCAKYKSKYNNGAHMSISNTKFKYEINYTRNETTNLCIFDAYMFVNSENGSYNVTYQTPQASGYIVVDGDTANPIMINATNVNIGIWDIGLHHVQVYTGDSAVVAFRGFLLEQQS